MRWTSVIAAFVILSTFFLITEPRPVSAGPEGITATIEVPAENRIVLGNKTTTVSIEGYFAILERSGLDTVGTISANLEVIGGEWAKTLSRNRWNDVEKNNNYDFTLKVEVPPGVGAGQSESYNLVLTFRNQFDQEVGSASAGTLLVVETIIDIGDDDEENDDVLAPVEDGSVSLLIPIFVLGLVIGLVVVLIWARKNLELVRSQDGRRRIYLREKDSGHIVGRKDDPPIELD